MKLEQLLSAKSIRYLQKIWLADLEKKMVNPSLQELDTLWQEIELTPARIWIVWEKKYNIKDALLPTSMSDVDYYDYIQQQAHRQMNALLQSSGQMLGLLLCQVHSTHHLASLSGYCLYDPLYQATQSHPLIHHQHMHISQGDYILLKAYSGQLMGIWNHAQWAHTPYQQHLFSYDNMHTQTNLALCTQMIKACAQIDRNQISSSLGSSIQQKSMILKKLRKKKSQTLAHTMHRSCHLYDGSYNEDMAHYQTLAHVWPKAPMGTADCCAPKLLSHMYRLQLDPIGLAEFWWHPQQKDHRHHAYGALAQPCQDRCMPLIERVWPALL